MLEPPREGELDRFWSKVDRSGGLEACWPWLGAQSNYGYGSLTRRQHRVSATRLIYSWLVALIPEGLCVLHRCDNPPCVNPTHLCKTHKANSEDMARKDRSAFGVKQGAVKLDNARVLRMRAEHAAGATQQSLADKFGVHIMTVNAVVRYQTWRRVK